MQRLHLWHLREVHLACAFLILVAYIFNNHPKRHEYWLPKWNLGRWALSSSSVVIITILMALTSTPKPINYVEKLQPSTRSSVSFL